MPQIALPNMDANKKVGAVSRLFHYTVNCITMPLGGSKITADKITVPFHPVCVVDPPSIR